MKYSKKIRGMSTALAFAFIFMVFSFSFAPKVYAAEYSGNATIGYNVLTLSNGVNKSYTKDITLPAVNATFDSGAAYGSEAVWLAKFYTDTSVTFPDVAKLYASFYFYRTAGPGNFSLNANVVDKENWQFTYTNHLNNVGYLSDDLFSIDTMSKSGAVGGKIINVEAKYQGSEAFPIRTLGFAQVGETGARGTSTSTGRLTIYFTSARIITTAYTAEMEALDNVANQIIAQNDILQAMKGDIVAILQDIYTMTGDIHIAQNLLNGYIQQMLPLIQSIDQTTTNIYALLGSQLRALEAAVENAATTVEAAIQAQTAAMIAYLEEMFNTGNEVPNETYEQQQDAENILDQMESLEKPDVETIVPEIDDYSDGGVSGVMSAIFSSNLIVTMMTLSASLAFGAYVLFGKRS